MAVEIDIREIDAICEAFDETVPRFVASASVA
jgi:hypothetical protein